MFALMDHDVFKFGRIHIQLNQFSYVYILGWQK